MTRTIGIHHARNAGIGRARQRQPLFDGAHARCCKMLIRPRRLPIPAVIGDIDQKLRPVFSALTTSPGKIAS